MLILDEPTSALDPKIREEFYGLLDELNKKEGFIIKALVVGSLISSLIIFPTVTALQVSKGFKGTIIISSMVSVICVIMGVFLSFIWNLPTGATIVMLNALCFAVFFCIKKLNIV